MPYQHVCFANTRLSVKFSESTLYKVLQIYYTYSTLRKGFLAQKVLQICESAVCNLAIRSGPGCSKHR